MRLTPVVLSLGCALLVGCSGDKATDSTDPTTGVGTGGTTNGGTAGGTVSSAGWTLSGTAVDFPSGTPVAEGACFELIDPSPALTGGDPESLGTGTIGAGGSFTLDGVVTSSTLGLLFSVKDCGTQNTTLFTTASAIQYADIRYLSGGDTLSGVVATSFTMAYVNDMQTSAAALGYTGDLETEGFFYGIVLDNGGTPVNGATVTCGDCGPTYYLDNDPLDGLFSTGASANTSTSAAANAGALIPAGPIGQYTVEDGGTHTWEIQLLGSNPASGLVATFTANP